MKHITLIGHIGSDPDFKTTDDGRKEARASLAITQTFTNRGGEEDKKTQWHNLVARGSQADDLKAFKKGSHVAVHGTLSERTYEAKDGSKRTHTEIVIIQISEFESQKE